MTYKERVTIEHPDNVDSRFEGGCSGCPINYGYVAPGKNLCREFDGDCEKCWNSEMPETENYILKGAGNMTITLDVGRELNNFTLANAIYETCKNSVGVRLDAEAIADMLLAQISNDYRKKYEVENNG